MATTISIRVFNVSVTGVDDVTGPHLMARGFLPSGQLLIDGRICAGHSPSVRESAVADIVGWLRAHRPGWDVDIDDKVIDASRGWSLLGTHR